jgi:hypothetical protein
VSAWTGDELDRIAAAEELDLAVRHEGGAWLAAARSTRAGRVSAGDVARDITSAGGGDDVDDAIDAAYREKYGGSDAVVAMVAPTARATTLRLVPAPTEA